MLVVASSVPFSCLLAVGLVVVCASGVSLTPLLVASPLVVAVTLVWCGWRVPDWAIGSAQPPLVGRLRQVAAAQRRAACVMVVTAVTAVETAAVARAATAAAAAATSVAAAVRVVVVPSVSSWAVLAALAAAGHGVALTPLSLSPHVVW